MITKNNAKNLAVIKSYSSLLNLAVHRFKLLTKNQVLELLLRPKRFLLKHVTWTVLQSKNVNKC